jgi:hypothetical protein
MPIAKPEASSGLRALIASRGWRQSGKVILDEVPGLRNRWCLGTRSASGTNVVIRLYESSADTKPCFKLPGALRERQGKPVHEMTHVVDVAYGETS